MARVVLALTNHAFTPSIWAVWASAPYDLVLATEDGSIGAHCGMLLPLSPHLASIVEGGRYTGSSQVLLMNTSIKAVAAVKELVYTGAFHLDKVMHSEEGVAEILDTMSVLGIKVSINSFSLETEIPQDIPGVQSNIDVLEGVKEELEDEYVVKKLKISERSEDLGKASLMRTGFEEIWKEEIGHINKIQERNPGLEMEGGLCVGEKLQIEKKSVACNFEGCKVKLSSRGSLNGHIRNVHKKEKPFGCNQCLKKFKKRANLRRHTDTVHAKLKPFQCEEAGCSKEFSTKNLLKSHVRIFHLRERLHACYQPGCGEMFGMKINLKRHMIKVHNFEKPHLCVEKNCGQKFEERRQLKDHLRSVHGAEKLACDIGSCTRTFIWSSGLYEHKKRHTLCDTQNSASN